MPRVKSNVMPELSGVFVNIYGARRCVRRGREASLIMPFYSSASLLLPRVTEHFSPSPSLPLSRLTLLFAHFFVPFFSTLPVSSLPCLPFFSLFLLFFLFVFSLISCCISFTYSSLLRLPFFFLFLLLYLACPFSQVSSL